jgi:hypothetical protein
MQTIFNVNNHYKNDRVKFDIIDMKLNSVILSMSQTDRQKKMRGGVFSKNICKGASEPRNENIKVSGTLTKLNHFILYLLTEKNIY